MKSVLLLSKLLGVQHLPLTEMNASFSLGIESDIPFSISISQTPLASIDSSATSDVVRFNTGKLSSFDIKLKTAIDTPTAASSTDPLGINQQIYE